MLQTTSSSSSLSSFFARCSVILMRNSVMRRLAASLTRAAVLTRGWTKFLQMRRRFLVPEGDRRDTAYRSRTRGADAGTRGSVATLGTSLRGVATSPMVGGRGNKGTSIG